MSSYTKYDFFLFICRWNMKIIPEEDKLLFLFHDNNCVVIVKCDYLMFIG